MIFQPSFSENAAMPPPTITRRRHQRKQKEADNENNIKTPPNKKIPKDVDNSDKAQKLTEAATRGEAADDNNKTSTITRRL